MSSQIVAIILLISVTAYLMSSASDAQSRMTGIATRRRNPRPDTDGSLEVMGGQPRRAVSQQNLAKLSCALCGIVIWLLVTGVLGIVAGLAVAVIGPKLLVRFESRSVRVNRLLIEASAPMVADLMAACLASGASTVAATRATAEALGGPVAEVLNQCVVQFNLGAGPTQVWRPLGAEPSLAPIARAILRSAETGAPLTAVLLRVSDDLRLARRAQLEQAAKTVGVKAVGPLGLCFLPAFMLLGVVPLIASLISAGISG